MAIRYVSTTGTDSGSALTLATAWATLQYAEDNASANDTIIVSTGTYNENDATNNCFNPAKAMTWQTDGGEVIVTSTSTTYVILPQGTTAAISFDGFTFDGETNTTQVIYTATSHDNKTFTNCTFKDGSTSLYVNSGASTGISFTNCTFTGTHTGSTFNNNIADVTIDNCTITTTSSNHLVSHSNGDLTFTNNTVSWTGGSSDDLINNSGSGDSTITGNTVTIAGSVINIFQTQTGSTSGAIDISDNTFTCSVAIGVPFLISVGTHAVTISGNTMTFAAGQNSTYIIRILDQAAPIIENNIIDTTAATVRLEHIRVSSTGTATKPVIRGNTCYTDSRTSGACIIVGDDTYNVAHYELCNDGIIENNAIYGPVYYGNAANGLHGIEYAYSLRGIVQGNYINGCSFGVVIKGGDNVSAGQDYNYQGGAFGNVIVNCDESQPIRIKGIANCIVGNNLITSNTATTPTACVNVTVGDASEPATGCRIKNNIFDLDTSKPLVVVDVASATSLDSDNNCFYNSGADGFSYSVGVTTYTSLALLQAGGQDASSFTTDPELNSDFTLPSTSQCVGTGTKYWGSLPTPTGRNQEPFASFGTDIGANQSAHGPFHPLNL